MPSTIIPILQQPESEGLKKHVHDYSKNIFERIIRDPTASHRPARERRCAEMLCAVLLNCQTFKIQTFEKLAGRCGWSTVPVSELEYEIDTEQSICGKRDDLRIEGFSGSGDERKRVLLWTIEIKVQAGIHYSSRLDIDGKIEEAIAESVPQIENYDRWLQTQNALRKAGIVISISSLESKVNELSLKEEWHCLRWTDLGEWTEDLLESETLPTSEKMLVRHFLGFLWQHLWDPAEMNSHQIGIDDLSLIRAFAVEGRKCEKRVNNLVEPLTQSFKDSGIKFCTEPKIQQTLFKTYLRAMVYASLIPDTATKPSPYLNLMVGIRRDEACVWIESSPACPWKARFREVCKQREKELQETNPDWLIYSQEEPSWKDIVLSKSLAWLLLENDQVAAMKAFVDSAIDDLKDTGVIATMQAIPQHQSR